MIFLFAFLITSVSIATAAALGYVLWEKVRKLKELQDYTSQLEQERSRAAEIISSRDTIISDAQSQGEQMMATATSGAQKWMKKQDSLMDEVAQLEAHKKALCEQLRSLTEDFEFSSLNFYTPHYDFEKSLDFERALLANRDEQKNLIRLNAATTVQPTLAPPDKKIATVLSKLLIRTFNSESDLLLARVDYKNIVVYESRLNNSFEQLNRLTMRFGVELSKDFLDLKIAELRLYHEQQEKIHQEAEEQRQIKEIMREEIRAEREMEKAKEDAEKEMHRYEDLLERATAAAQAAQGAEIEKKNAQIALLREQLQAVVEKVRSISQAQQTKTGYVYVISNIGSFGDGVFKIGMTRRLNPQERIDELGDASVPFAFDIHAMIRHDNAPELEAKLHQYFDSRRMNKINTRKEFFKVSLDEIEAAAREFGAQVNFTKVAEAREYRESLAMEQKASA